jgi:acetylornithine deacetylase/succinyl-diaminopimelate desuccinylase-like protein
MAQHNTKEFNDEVKLAIDDAISTILGPQVVKALYFHLKEHYDITSDEIPYRLDTLFDALEKTFGVKGALTLGRVIARRFYARMGLKFVELGNYKLQDYLEDAKIDLALSTRTKNKLE